MKNLTLDTSQLELIPGNAETALDFSDFGGVADYSKLDIKQVLSELGFNHTLSESWMLNGAFYYYLYDDLAEYLYTDTTGKSYSFYLGLTWTK